MERNFLNRIWRKHFWEKKVVRKFILIRFRKEFRGKNVGRTLEKKLLRVSVHSYMMWSGGMRIPPVCRSSSKKGRASNPSSKEMAEEEEGWRKRRSQSGKGKERTRLNAVTVTLSGQVPPWRSFSFQLPFRSTHSLTFTLLPLPSPRSLPPESSSSS